VKRWSAKGISAIVDQGLISGSNFVLGILLARWLGPEQYGAYALAFTIFILLSLVYQSLLLEPMSVYGAATYRDCLRHYSGTLLRIHWAIASATFVVMGATAWLLSHQHLAKGVPSALVGAAVAAPCVLLFWLIRRVYYLRVAPAQAALGALLYCGAMFGGIALLREWRFVSPITAYLTMAFAALVTSGFLLARYMPSFAVSTGPSLRQVRAENWAYGRWALASAIFMWVPWNIFYTLLSGFDGMAGAGQLRALLNFALPMAQTYGAMSLLFIPHAARSIDHRGERVVERVSGRITWLFLACGVAYWVPVIVFRGSLLKLFYHGEYFGVGNYIAVVAAASVLWGMAQGPAIALRANKTPFLVFHIYFGSAIVALAAGIPLTKLFGLAGATLAMLMASLSAWLIGCWRVRKVSPSSRQIDHEQIASEVA